jgi:hypothetical protein
MLVSRTMRPSHRLVHVASPVSSKPCFRFAQTACPAGPFSLRSPQPNTRATSHDHIMQPDVTTRRSAGGRPNGDPAAVRSTTIGVRVSAGEYVTLRAKAAQLHLTPAQWLREAALARCLPSPPVAAINREQYAELARLAANLNQLTRLANEGGRVTVANDLLASMTRETKRLRLSLLGIGEAGDDR